MSYSTNTSILFILPGLPQTDTTEGYTTTVAIIEDHIDRADNIINSKIVKRFDVSQFATEVPPMLKTLSEDISSYFTYRSLYSGDNQNFNEWTDKFNMAMELLNELKEGEIDLVDDSGNIIEDRTTATIDRIVSSTEDYQPFFDEDDPLDWKLDDEKKDSIKDAR